MSFAVLLELATLVAYIIIILGGQQLRQYGWKVVVSLLAAIVLVQCSGMAIIVCWDFRLPTVITNPTRPTSSTTMNVSSRAGNSILHGSSAPCPGQ